MQKILKSIKESKLYKTLIITHVLLFIIIAVILLYYINFQQEQHIMFAQLTKLIQTHRGISAQGNSQLSALTKLNSNRVIFLFITLFIIFIIIFYYIRTTRILISKTNQLFKENTKIQNQKQDLQGIIEKRNSQLQESNSFFRSVFENNQSIMLMIDHSNADIVYANKSAANFYGYSIEELTNMKITDLNVLPPEELIKKMKSSLHLERTHIIFQHKTAQGVVKDIETYSEKILLNGKSLLFSIIHDITELQRTRKQLVEAKHKAEESDQLKSAFLANMSHEIRTPLNAILGFTDLVTNYELEQVQKSEYIGLINQASVQLTQIVDDMIVMSKIESNQLELKKELFNVQQIVLDTVCTFRNSPTTPPKNIEFKFNYPSQAEILINTDKLRFSQIITSLLSNAYKFTDTGHIEIGYFFCDNSNIKFYITDTGCGIEPEKFDLIFQRFTQGDNINFNDGNGLGLSIAKGLVDILGGNISFKSEIDKGSTFSFTLPLNNKL